MRRPAGIFRTVGTKKSFWEPLREIIGVNEKCYLRGNGLGLQFFSDKLWENLAADIVKKINKSWCFITALNAQRCIKPEISFCNVLLESG